MGAQSYLSGGRGAAWHHCAEDSAYLDPETFSRAGHRRTDGRDRLFRVFHQAMRAVLQDFAKIIRSGGG